MNQSIQESASGGVAQQIQAAVKVARAGDKFTARRMLLDIVESDPTQEGVWLWLAGLSDDPKEAKIYLDTVLALDPDHEQAKRGLRIVEQRLTAQAKDKSARLSSPQSAPSPTPNTPAAAPKGRRCEKCGSLIPDTTSVCPKCAHVEGKPAVNEVIELAAVGAGEDSVEQAADVNAEISPSFMLSIKQAELIDECLERMAYESEASCIILADVTGQLISERGKTNGMNTQVLTALAAGELSATQEMARLVGEKARFSLLLHEGEERSVYLSPVGQKMLLIVVFDGRTPIGLVRIILKNAVDELGPILDQPPAQGGEATLGETLSDDFAQRLEDEMDASLALFDTVGALAPGGTDGD